MNKLKIIMNAIKKVDNYPSLFLDYMELKTGEVVYKINNKRILTRCQGTDKEIFIEVALTPKYFPSWLKLKKNDIVIDVGAHIGVFSVLIDRKVYAIEPNKENFKVLKRQLKYNKTTKIIPFNIALSDKKGKEMLYLGNSGSHSSFYNLFNTGFIMVETDTLTSFMNDNNIKECALLKMDIEGGEYKVLYSTPQETFDKIKKIFIEIHHIIDKDKQHLIDFIESKGFHTIKYDDGFYYFLK